MIAAWVVAVAGLIASLGTGFYFNRENKKTYDEAYNKGFHDAMASRILEIHQKGETAYAVTWEEDHHD